MKLTPPFPLSTIAQKFGDNAVPLYTAGLGLKGHPGIDFGVPWGTDIPAAADAYCYSTILNKDPAFYQAVYTIVDDPDGNSYEVSYGHCSSIEAEPKVSYETGRILAKVGNTGSVYSNGLIVSELDKLNGSRAGAHLHFQVRLLKKSNVENFDPQKHYINDGQGQYVTPDGYAYEVPLWNNGYNGCIDPAPFFVAEQVKPVINAVDSPLSVPVDSRPTPAPLVVASTSMNTIATALKSRTVWTVFAMFLVGGVSAITNLIPVQYLVYVQGALALLAGYFKLSPSQSYGA